MSRKSWVAAWLVSGVVLTLAAVGFLEVAHSGWLTDVCDRPQASPRTPGGFTVVAASVVVPFVVAAASRVGRLVAVAGVVALLGAAIWNWALAAPPC